MHWLKNALSMVLIREVFEELSREANMVFGRYNLEYELVGKKR